VSIETRLLREIVRSQLREAKSNHAAANDSIPDGPEVAYWKGRMDVCGDLLALIDGKEEQGL